MVNHLDMLDRWKKLSFLWNFECTNHVQFTTPVILTSIYDTVDRQVIWNNNVKIQTPSSRFRALSEMAQFWLCLGYWIFSSSSSRAKFFFSPHTPESPISVGCRSNGHNTDRPWSGRRVRHWWQHVWPQTNNRGTLSPWKRKTSLQTLHSLVWNQN